MRRAVFILQGRTGYMNKKALATAMVVMGLFPSLLFGQLYRMDVDVQDAGIQKVIDRVFTGNTVGLDVGFYDGGYPLVVTNWTMLFRYYDSQYSTNPPTQIVGVASSNRVSFDSTTNLFYSANENYYFSISGVDNLGHKRTFARGRMIEEYDPATAGSGGVSSNGVYFISWGNIYGDPASNSNLVDFIEEYAGADSVARVIATWASNAAAWSSNNFSTVWARGESVTGAVDSTARSNAASNAASIIAVGAVASNAVSGQGIRLWADATTNYHAILEDGATAFSSTSFSATFNWCVTNGKTAGLYAPIIELGPSVMADGSEVDYAIDAPIIVTGTNSGPQAITVRGYGNIGTSIKVATNYTGRMFVFTNMYSIIRFESIRFQDWLSANTNPVIESSAAEHVLVDCEFTGWKGSAIRQHGYHGGAGSSWNRIESCWFIGNTNEYPMIDLNSPAFDWTISDCHFSKWNATTTDVIRISGEVDGVKILGCRFLSTGAVGDNGYCTINVLGGKGLLASGNTFHGEGYKSQIFRFDPATSNDYRALVIGNNAANSYATNFVYIGTNAHNIKVVWNQLDGYIRSAVSVTTNSGKIIVYNGTADVLRVSALGLGTNAAVSNWPASGGGIDEAAEAGQIATNVLSTATTNSMPLIDFSSGGGIEGYLSRTTLTNDHSAGSSSVTCSFSAPPHVSKMVMWAEATNIPFSKTINVEVYAGSDTNEELRLTKLFSRAFERVVFTTNTLAGAGTNEIAVVNHNHIVDGSLMFVSRADGATSEFVRVSAAVDAGSWTTPFYDGAQEQILSLCVYDGKLYAGQGSGAGDGDVFRFVADGMTTLKWPLRNSYGAGDWMSLCAEIDGWVGPANLKMRTKYVTATGTPFKIKALVYGVE